MALDVANNKVGLRRFLIIQISLLFVSLYYLGGTIWLCLQEFHLDRFQPIVVDSGLYSLLFIPIVYWLEPTVFQRTSWKLHRLTWVGIIVAIVIQCLIEATLTSGHGPLSNLRILRALIFAPPIEEIIRAAMILPLERRGQPTFGITLSAFLFAFAHANFRIELLPCIVLGFILVKTRCSIPSAIAAHFAMNLISVTWR